MKCAANVDRLPSSGTWQTSQVSHWGSSEHFTAAPPHSSPGRRLLLLRLQEEGVSQGGGQGDAFGGLVLQQLLQQVDEVLVLQLLWQHVLLEETQTEGGRTYWQTDVRVFVLCFIFLYLKSEGLHVRELTASGLHLAFTWRPALECSFQSRRPRWKYFCFLERS